MWQSNPQAKEYSILPEAKNSYCSKVKNAAPNQTFFAVHKMCLVQNPHIIQLTNIFHWNGITEFQYSVDKYIPIAYFSISKGN
jgi:hypothetical protein